MYPVLLAFLFALLLSADHSLAQIPTGPRAKARAPLTSLPAPTGTGETALPLSPGDLLEVRVFQEDEMTTETRISSEGKITLPLVGAVPVSGQTSSQAALSIRARLMQGYFLNPQVSVIVTSFAKRVFTVIGEVQKGGAYEMAEGTVSVDLLQAIGIAGGYTRLADPRKVTIKRRSGVEERVIRVDAKSMASGRGPGGFEIQPGDTIIVGQSLF